MFNTPNTLKLAACVVALLSVVGLASCGGDSDTARARATAQHYYAALAAHDWAKACGYHAAVVNATAARSGGCVALLRKHGHDIQIPPSLKAKTVAKLGNGRESVELSGTHGVFAVVYVKKERGEWKVEDCVASDFSRCPIGNYLT